MPNNPYQEAWPLHRRTSVIRQCCLDLTQTELNLLLAISDHCINKPQCWPGRDLLVTITRLSRETVSRTISRLKAKGYLKTYWRPTPGGRQMAFKLLLDKLTEKQQEAAATVTESHTEDDITVTESHSDCDGESQRLCAPVTEGVTESHTEGRKKQKPKEKPNLSRERGEQAQPKKTLPANNPEGFQEFVSLWSQKLPNSPAIGSADLVAWAEAWDSHAEFHRDGFPFALLDAISEDDFFAGRKASASGQRFVMQPSYLLRPDPKSDSDQPRWQLAIEGRLGGLGRSLNRVLEQEAKDNGGPHRLSRKQLDVAVFEFLQDAKYRKLDPLVALEDDKIVRRALNCGSGELEFAPESVKEFHSMLKLEIERKAQAQDLKLVADKPAAYSREAQPSPAGEASVMEISALLADEE